MSDAEPPVGSEDADSGDGAASFLNSTPKLIGAITALIGAISGLLLALNKAGFLGDGNDSATGTTTTTSTSEEVKGLFVAIDRPEWRVYFEDSAMYVDLNEPGVRVHVANQSKDMQDVKMSTRVRWVSGASDYGFALLCRYRGSKNYYLLGVAPGRGEYNIARIAAAD